MINRLFVTISALTLFAASSYATVNLQFGLAGQARATGFGDHLATVSGTNGMRWGILVDTSNTNVFQAGQYDIFDIETSGFLLVGGVATDDYYFTHPTDLVTALAGTTATTGGTDPGGNGAITTINPLTITGITGLESGDPFGIIWFESTPAPNSYYGLLTNQSATAPFDLPPDGANQPYTAFFAGPVADPIKPATFQFAGVAVPEPSVSLLAFAGFGLALLRRRRK